MPRGFVVIYFPIYHRGPFLPLIKTEYYLCVWTVCGSRERHYRERKKQRERECERRYFDAGEKLPLTLAGKSIFRFCFVTLQLNSIYSVPTFHCLWIESSATLAADFFVCSALFHSEASLEEKSTLLAKWGLGFGVQSLSSVTVPFFSFFFFFVIRYVSINSLSHKCHCGVVFRPIPFFLPNSSLAVTEKKRLLFLFSFCFG